MFLNLKNTLTISTSNLLINRYKNLVKLKHRMSGERLSVALGVRDQQTHQKTWAEKHSESALQKLRIERRKMHFEKTQVLKKKTNTYLPGTVHLQVLGAGANGAPCAVYLFTDTSRYLFNCGEGTQRLAHEHKTKLSRLEQIFMTRNTWPMIGGVPGLTLTVQDAGVKELALHGPPHLDKILESMKRFVVLKNLQIKTLDCTEMQDFEDSVLTVKCIPLLRNEGYEPALSESVATYQDKIVIAYICRLKPRPGTLNLEKCVAHGVPPGPLLGMLKNGVDVTLTDGTVVKSKDVSEPGEVPQTFVFLDIPDASFLSSLDAEASRFRDLTLNGDNELAVCVHFSPESILENNRYQSFMRKMCCPETTQHIYLNSKFNSFSGYVAAHRIQYKLNQLNENIFPLLTESEPYGVPTIGNNNKLKKTKLLEVDDVEERNKKEKIIANDGISSLTSFHLRPRKGFDKTAEAKLTPSEYIQETQILPDFPVRLKQLKEEMKDRQVTYNTPYPKITFLGTGSCIPNKTRNVSAILLETQPDKFMILDCGEGTLGQIIRFFGKSRAEVVIKNLKAIYVSHLHADHHIGLIGLLNERQRLLRRNDNEPIEKLLLFAPAQIKPWLNFYDKEIMRISDAFDLIGNAEMLEEPFEPMAARRLDLGFDKIKTCLVRHCPHSFGVRVDIDATSKQSPLSLTYSGDTTPCNDLIVLGRKTTILIHEATMEDDLVEEARIKMHSTISQAVNQGLAMQADYIILTHFSQRYAKLPRMQATCTTSYSETAKSEEERNAIQLSDMLNVSIAFDNMHISLDDLQHFHLLYPALRSLFAENAEELDQKALKRELKLERKRKLLSTD